MFNQTINRVGTEIQATMKRPRQTVYKYSVENIRPALLPHIVEKEKNYTTIVGAIAVFYSKEHFMTLDRIQVKNNNFKKQRRIIYYLDSRLGQVGSTVLLELLKLHDGTQFSKNEFVNTLDTSIFRDHNISSGEINDVLSRMMRRTFSHFFGVNGRKFIRKNFPVYFQEITNHKGILDQENYYRVSKPQIDQKIFGLIKEMKKLAFDNL